MQTDIYLLDSCGLPACIVSHRLRDSGVDEFISVLQAEIDLILSVNKVSFPKMF